MKKCTTKLKANMINKFRKFLFKNPKIHWKSIKFLPFLEGLLQNQLTFPKQNTQKFVKILYFLFLTFSSTLKIEPFFWHGIVLIFHSILLNKSCQK
jgi:hypothetical protein